jgi:glycyl-tRNA synthetase
MQDALVRLSTYWSDQGCLIVQPMNTEVGAGTLNPATALRVLGPEPWHVGYVEPSVRPDDSRYGENPNRLQTHTQYQVILKPEPGNPQEIFLGSLAALGIDLEAHDVRFVEDNWASPALGAWGLGWEVWLDGLEITQFTYFQQGGGQVLDPPSVEITYGMERILMALQGARHFKDIVYAPGVTYGELFGQAEYEMSRYYLDDADVAVNRRVLDMYAGEAERLIDAGLPIPAHSYVLKMSHAFNVLDARGVVATAERAAEFARMRRLSSAVAQLWVATRQKAGFPLLAAHGTPTAATSAAHEPGPGRPGMGARDPKTSSQTLVFEIGTEEMPPGEAASARSLVAEHLEKALSEGRLAHGGLTAWATPRRIVVTVTDVAAWEEESTQVVRGPRVGAAYSADGEPTPAAIGFAKANKITVADLARVTEGGVEYVTATRHEAARKATDALAPVLATVVRRLRSSKNMRWSDPELSFTRPIRWLVALLGEDVIPVRVGNLTAGRVTTLTRVAAGQAQRAGLPATATLAAADEHAVAMSTAGIVVDQAQRRARITAGALRLAQIAGGTIDANAEADLLDQINYLVEQPSPFLGSFDPRYLELPEAVLTTVMRKHQRYLPVRAPSGELLPQFIGVANGIIDEDVVRAGNEAVLRARFEDAAFFFRADLKTPLSVMRERLRRLTFTEKLGSILERAERIACLAGELERRVSLEEPEREVLARASELVKFDLGSSMVIELTSLAGTMAREYALAAGESPAVAAALLEAEMPRSAGDAVPATTPGALLALADRLDSLVGLAATVGIPTGSSDPFAVRRAALGTLALARSCPSLAGVSLHDGLAIAAHHQPVDVPDAIAAELRAFLERRLELQFAEDGYAVDHIRAVLLHADRPAYAERLLRQLSALRADANFREVAAALQRARRIVPDGVLAGYDPAMLTEPAERGLHAAVTTARACLSAAGDDADLRTFMNCAAVLTAPVRSFFDDILVMSDDPRERATRLGLLASVRDLGVPVLDWASLSI